MYTPFPTYIPTFPTYPHFLLFFLFSFFVFSFFILHTYIPTLQFWFWKFWMKCVKLLFTTLCFVGLYSVPNLIVMLFNLLYPVFIVGFHCKGCVLERDSVKTQATEDWRDFADSSRLSIPRKEACVLHMIGMRRVRSDGDSCVSRVSRG